MTAYGRAHCLFLLGFCLRPLGDFDRAWNYLRAANGLATDNGFERFCADSLMQMGEVRRCQGELDQARELLDESLERSKQLRLTVTHAFARSGLGAVEYHEQRLPEAGRAFEEADRLFRQCGHREGLALNMRRQAIAARKALDAAPRSGSDVVCKLIDAAWEAYWRLSSPAGLVACEIERGRLELRHGGRTNQVVTLLLSRLDDARQWLLLEMDPWVPQLLVAFANDAESDELARRAHRLVLKGGRQLERVHAEAVEIEHHVVAPSVVTESRPGPDEMGGEPRHAVVMTVC